MPLNIKHYTEDAWWNFYLLVCVFCPGLSFIDSVKEKMVKLSARTDKR